MTCLCEECSSPGECGSRLCIQCEIDLSIEEGKPDTAKEVYG